MQTIHDLESAFRRAIDRKCITAAPKLPAQVAKARKHFYAAGWSYRSAAAVLGVSYQHLCQVLTGERQSRRLIQAVLALPNRSA